MGAALNSRRSAHSGRLAAALVATALPVITLAAAGQASAATAAGCKAGSGPHLAGQRVTAAEVTRYEDGSGLECADLARANLSGLRLIQIDLTGANLSHANLRSADLTQATMNRANLTGADLRKAKLIQAELKDANLSHADLRYANLGQATLTHADLASAKLTKATLEEVQAGGANFRSANLTDADFSGAMLTGAHFGGADTRGASFTGATGAPAGQSGGVPGAGAPAGPGTGPVVKITKRTWQMYTLTGAALIFLLMSLGSVRRYFATRTSGRFLGGPGAGYGGFNRGYGGAAGAYGTPWGGNDASGYAAQPTPFSTTPYGQSAANPYGPMPTAFAPQWRGAGRLARLGLAILGALVVAIGLWLIGTTVIDAVLVPAGKAGYRLCESTCGTRFSGHTPFGLGIGVVLLAVGGTLRAIGRIRY